MFCTKCGRENKEGALFCEFCGTPMTQAQTPAAPAPQQVQPVKSVRQSAAQVQKKKSSSKKSDDAGKRMALIAALIALIIMCVVSAVLIIVGLKNRKADEFVGGDGSYYKEFSEDDVIFPEDGEAYVDHQLLITVDDDTTGEDLQKTLKSYGGKIVGFNTISNTYQVEFSKKSGDDLVDLIDEIEKESGVESATLNYVYYNESLIGSSNSLDDSLMGIANSDYDDSLIGELNVALIGTAIDNSGVGDLIPSAKMADAELKDGGLVSLFGWECEVANKADEGCELFEVASKLVPTYDAEKDKMLEELNKGAADFFNKMKEQEYEFMILSTAQGGEPGFIDGIKDEKAMEQILCVAAAADAGAAPGVDIFAEGASPEALEYATSIALITWANNIEMTGENLKDVLANSYVDPLADGIPGVLNAELSAEVSRRLHDMVATATDSDYELNAADILKMIEDVKVDLGLISPEEVPEEAAEPEPVEDTSEVDFAAENGRFAGYFSNGGYAELADRCYFDNYGIVPKYSYADLDGDGINELMIGDDSGIFAIVSETGGAYTVSEIYGWQNQMGPSSAGFIGNGCFTSDLYFGNAYGSESGVQILWKYTAGQCVVIARLSNSWAIDTPSDQLPQNCWDLYVVNDESLAITSEEDVKISSDYTYEHLDYGEYYNRDTQQYENDLCTKYNSTVDSYRGEDTYLDTLPWNPVSDFQ